MTFGLLDLWSVCTFGLCIFAAPGGGGHFVHVCIAYYARVTPIFNPTFLFRSITIFCCKAIFTCVVVPETIVFKIYFRWSRSSPPAASQMHPSMGNARPLPQYLVPETPVIPTKSVPECPILLPDTPIFTLELVPEPRIFHFDAVHNYQNEMWVPRPPPPPPPAEAVLRRPRPARCIHPWATHAHYHNI